MHASLFIIALFSLEYLAIGCLVVAGSKSSAARFFARPRGTLSDAIGFAFVEVAKWPLALMRKEP